MRPGRSAISSRAQRPGGEAGRASIKYARSLVSEAIKLVVWLHGRQLELRDLRQDLIDEWIAAGLRTRRRVRMFLSWSRRASVTGPLQVAWDDHPATRQAIDDEQRIGIHQSRAAAWVRLAGGTYAEYVALRAVD